MNALSSGAASAPSIVDRGLILDVDTGNPDCLSNPTRIDNSFDERYYFSNKILSSNAVGAYYFDGSASLTASTYQQPTNNFSIEGWCQPTATHGIDTQSTSGFGGNSGQKWITSPVQMGSYGGAGISVGTNGVSVYEHGSSYMPALLVWTGTLSRMTHICVVYTARTPSLYIDGVFVKTGLTSPKTYVYGNIQYIGYGQYGYFTGYIASIREYNVSLTAEEVLQNYEARKGFYQ